VRGCIERAVRFLMTSVYQKGAPRGCFAANSALELADRDPAVAKQVGIMLSEVRDAFEDSISQPQKLGQLRTTTSARVLADFLINSIEGVRVVEKTRPRNGHLDALADFVLQSLGKVA
jgi:TetR/AcrR family transcriptional repressor of nem operon